MKHILKTMFLQDVINNIDEKYKTIVESNLERYFTYANIFEMTLYYNLFTYKKNPEYGLYNKINTTKHAETILFLIQLIRENNYNTNQLLTLYSYICHISLNYYIEGYQISKIKNKKIFSQKKRMINYSRIGKYIEAQFYQDRYYTNIRDFKLDVSKLKLTDDTFEAIDELCKNIYYNSFGVKIYKKSYHKFIKYQSKNYKGLRFLHRFTAYILDLLTRSKKESAASIYNISKTPKRDYLNKDNILWLDGDCEMYKSFNQLYQEALTIAINLINIISSDIFYNTKSDAMIIKQINKIKSRQ